MTQCDQLRRFLDGEMGPMGRWRMRWHLRHCAACTEQKAAEAAIGEFLTDSAYDTAADAAAAARVTAAWLDTVPERSFPARRAARVSGARGWMSLSLAGGVAALILIGVLVTRPTSALAHVKEAMAKIRRFHIRMDVLPTGTHYEAWGSRDLGARIEERMDGRLTMIVIDDNRKIHRYAPNAKVMQDSPSRLKAALKDAAGFQATRLLHRASHGRLLEGEEWGEAKVSKASQVTVDGVLNWRIAIDIENGPFTRMIAWAPVKTDRLETADLFLGGELSDDQPFARVSFDYPDRLDPKLFVVPKNKRAQWSWTDEALP